MDDQIQPSVDINKNPKSAGNSMLRKLKEKLEDYISFYDTLT